MMNFTVPLHDTCTVHRARSKLIGDTERVDFYSRKKKGKWDGKKKESRKSNKN